ncbi:MAG: radical SAM protein [Methylococcaceae bacterium]|jgi:wyosine [tRNA(Phe)-imidazoG37] synthetase (radical SAM superfamily)
MVVLTTTQHDRDVAGYKYIYPVRSRRAGGLSIGINFNPDNTCNWRCLYCQVPELKLGNAPPMDFGLLADELDEFFASLANGSFYQNFAIEQASQVIKDIAISGNGEPTSLKGFDKAISLIGSKAREAGLFPDSHFVLITNGSLIHRPKVQQGLMLLKQFSGEVWFKFDSATELGRRLINNSAQTTQSCLRHIRMAAALCPVRLQTCLVDYAGKGLTEQEKQAYLGFLAAIKGDIQIQSIMLYSLARVSYQPEAAELKALSLTAMDAFADEIRRLGYQVTVNV